MILDKYNENKDTLKTVFEGEYEGIVNGKAIFVADGKYIDSIGPTYIKYRLNFNDQEELREFIEDMIELYNSREPD